MIKTTRWGGGVCECVIDYEWDTETDEETRVHTTKSIVSACPAHAPLLDAKKIHKTKNAESALLQNTIHALAASSELLRNEERDKSGNLVSFTPNMDIIKWSFDENRKLVVNLDHEDFDEATKSLLQEEVEKVVISEKFSLE